MVRRSVEVLVVVEEEGEVFWRLDGGKEGVGEGWEAAARCMNCKMSYYGAGLGRGEGTFMVRRREDMAFWGGLLDMVVVRSRGLAVV